VTVPATALAPAAELDRQLSTLLDAGVPAAAGVSDTAFTEQVRRLLQHVPDDEPFVVALPYGYLPPLALVEHLSLQDKPGFSSMTAEELATFRPSPDVTVPDRPYLLVGVDTGADTLGVAPEKALPGLLADGRSPLTLEEGLCVVLQRPEVLREQNCFEMLGSRGTDRRVTGLWVMKGGAPRLGWCWWGAPHSWLGMATCRERRA
jgi:hypothetical protein